MEPAFFGLERLTTGHYPSSHARRAMTMGALFSFDGAVRHCSGIGWADRTDLGLARGRQPGGSLAGVSALPLAGW